MRLNNYESVHIGHVDFELSTEEIIGFVIPNDR